MLHVHKYIFLMPLIQAKYLSVNLMLWNSILFLNATWEMGKQIASSFLCVESDQ